MVVSSDPLFREAAAAFMRVEGWSVPMSEPDGLHALSGMNRHPIDVVLLIGEPGQMSAATFKLEVERRWPGTVVISVASMGQATPADVAFEAEPNEVIEALATPGPGRVVTAGEADQAVLRLALLTPRERTVLRHLARGRRPTEIADALGLSHHTIRSHLANLHRKLDVHRRVELIRLAASAGLLESDAHRPPAGTRDPGQRRPEPTH